MPNERQGRISQGNGRAIIVVGAGGHAKVLVDCLRYTGWNVIGCTDADPTPRNCAGAPVLGNDDILQRLRTDGVEHAFCALGPNGLRERVGEKLLSLGYFIPSVQGPGAYVSASVRVGFGAAILPGAIVNTDSVVGELAIINTKASVDHDGVIGRAAHIGPGAVLAGSVEIGARTFVATGSSIIPDRRIGPDTVIGAGSVVVRDLPGRVVAYGNPARVRRSL